MVNNLLKISFLLFLIILSRFVLGVDYNEMDVLPAAYAAFKSSWLLGDWYLSLSIPYRQLFGYIIGFFIDLEDFIPTLLFGRLVTYVLFGFAFFRLIETLKVNFLVGAAALMIYLTWFSEGIFYGEWMVGGLETKAFSYAFILLSIHAFLKEQWRGSLLLAGLALSFHILVGGYFIICLSIVSSIGFRKNNNGFKSLLSNSPYFLLGGIYGLFGIYSHLFIAGDSELAKYGWEIYTQVRVSFHVMPKFSFLSLIIPLILALFHFFIYRFSKDEKLKLISLLGLLSYAISLLGYFIYFTGEAALLRFYFFRLNDAMQPFLTLIIVGSIISSRLQFDQKSLAQRAVVGVSVISFVAFIFIHSSNLKELVNPSNYSKEAVLEHSSSDLKMSEWINENTSEESVIIVPLSMSNFYMEAERAIFVSWKHSPQSPEDILEWYKRLKLLNKNVDFLNVDNPIGAIHESYKNLTEGEILSIQQTYQELTHIVMPKGNQLYFPVLFETDLHVFYEIGNKNIPSPDQKRGKPKPN